jgi:NADH dehydrogenase
VPRAGALRPAAGDSLETANVGSGRAVARAVAGTGVRRILYLSYVGARWDTSNRYLAAKAAAEEELCSTGCDVIVLRCTHIVGPPESPGAFATAFLSRKERPVNVVGNGTQLVAPVALDDVVSAIVRASTFGRAGIYELAGPDLFDLDEFVGLLNGPDVRIRHLPGPIARLVGPILPGLSRDLVDLLLRDSLGDSTRAMAAFGLHPTSLRALWARP